MSEFENSGTKGSLTAKLWRGERVCLLGFDVPKPSPDLVGFAVECREPGASDFVPLKNRIAFSYDGPALDSVTGARIFPSTTCPFQKFRWVHFPREVKDGTYAYRVTAMHMPKDADPIKGDSIELDLSLDPVTYNGFLDVGFTRNFASSQAFLEKFKGVGGFNKFSTKIIPGNADEGLTFTKLQKPSGLYEWMRFEAGDLLCSFLQEAVADPSVSVDAMCYDFNEPELLDLLRKLGKRLRIMIDDSSSTDKQGNPTGHVTPGSAESHAATALRKTAGTGNVLRTHCRGLQHNKVLIAKRNGKPFKILAGSTNHSFRGLYIQANNILVFSDPAIAGLFGEYFNLLFHDAANFHKTDLASKWHAVHSPGRPIVRLCFAPHKEPELSLSVVGAAIDQASSSVFFNLAFLNQAKSGSVRTAIDRLAEKPIFSYGVSDKAGGLNVHKPDGTVALVDFAYLAEHSPEPFRSEWSGGKGINVHHKFVVTDFGLPSARVFTGSCNHSPSGEKNNGDHLIQIDDPKVAAAYAIEAVRVFDHLHFRSAMKKGDKTPGTITLKKPTALSGKPAWFEPYYQANSQKARDRVLFSH